MLGISRVAEPLLASQDGLVSMELLSNMYVRSCLTYRKPCITKEVLGRTKRLLSFVRTRTA
jgi:hypothetical protein